MPDQTGANPPSGEIVSATMPCGEPSIPPPRKMNIEMDTAAAPMWMCLIAGKLRGTSVIYGRCTKDADCHLVFSAWPRITLHRSDLDS